MERRRLYRLASVFLFLFLTNGFLFAQKLKKSEKGIVDNLKSHIGYLADDKLEGRRTGTAGEKLAMEYISKQFQQIGLEPKGTDGYYQAFEIYDGKEINSATHLIINNHDLKTGKEFFPLAFSGNESIEAYPAISLREEGMPWFMDLKEALEEKQRQSSF
ncbi:MAG: hypothetical protein HC867_02365 [Bacteroidia bacterium]|nr:hypothetical protein [Bacteroidia bacterium]